MQNDSEKEENQTEQRNKKLGRWRKELKDSKVL